MPVNKNIVSGSALPKKKKSFYDFLPDGQFSEEDLWDAIACANDLDVSEISDGDIVDWI
jgi:transketolase N-terminal domain/subunit